MLCIGATVVQLLLHVQQSSLFLCIGATARTTCQQCSLLLVLVLLLPVQQCSLFLYIGATATCSTMFIVFGISAPATCSAMLIVFCIGATATCSAMLIVFVYWCYCYLFSNSHCILCIGATANY